MKLYAKVIDKKTGACMVGAGTNKDFYTSEGFKMQEVEQSEKDGCWYLASKCPHYTDEEKAEIEKERIGTLTCTKRVFALALQEFGVPYSKLKECIASSEQAQLEWDLCSSLLRSNPLLDIMATSIGVTSEQLDLIFKYANGEITEEELRK